MAISAVSGVSSTSSTNDTAHLLEQEFQQVGKDLKAGNLSAAQADFVTLSSTAAKSATPTSHVGTDVRQQFGQLASDLQSGNLSAAQEAYTKLQQNLMAKVNSATPGTGAAGGHHRHGAGTSEITQLMDQIGTSTQTGNLSAALQSYAPAQGDSQKANSVAAIPSSSLSVSA